MADHPPMLRMVRHIFPSQRALRRVDQTKNMFGEERWRGKRGCEEGAAHSQEKEEEENPIERVRMKSERE